MPGPSVSRRCALVGLLVLLAAGYVVLSRDRQIPRGNELVTGGLNWTIDPLPPGEGFLLLLGMIQKEEPGQVEILDLSPIRQRGFPQIARLVRFALGPRGNGNPPLPQGVYVTYPPTTTLVSGECAVQKLEPVEGYELEHSSAPEVRALVATWIETESEGEALLDGVRVTYRSGEDELFQDIPLKITVQVAEGAPPFSLEPDERPCVGGVQILTTQGRRS